MQENFASGAIHTVGSITALIRQNLAENFPFLWVRGEVTDFSVSPSDHIYFSLRDKDALLQCVWFSGKRKKGAGRKFDPLTGEVYEAPPPEPEEMLRNGAEIVCAGSINVYPRGGRYQLVVEHAETAGLGAAALLLEQRRAKYAAAGYFDSSRKRSLAPNPACIALVTSLHGAAIHDFLTLSAKRGLSARIRIFPVAVQGSGAAACMATAIEEINRQNEAEVIVLIRGGGSREDLAEFNEEILIEAIYRSHIPVLAGIGHEVDTSLADMTADVRAATPSHAAQILWPLRSDLWQSLDELSFALSRRMGILIEKFSLRLSHAEKTLFLLSPWRRLERLEKQLSLLEGQLARATNRLIENHESQLGRLEERCDIARRLENRLVLDSKRLAHANGRLDFLQEHFLSGLQKALERQFSGLSKMGLWWLKKLSMDLGRLESRLEAANPYAPLQKGYAFCTINGHVLRSVHDCLPGDRVIARLWDGEIELQALRTRLLPPECAETTNK